MRRPKVSEEKIKESKGKLYFRRVANSARGLVSLRLKKKPLTVDEA